MKPESHRRTTHDGDLEQFDEANQVGFFVFVGEFPRDFRSRKLSVLLRDLLYVPPTSTWLLAGPVSHRLGSQKFALNLYSRILLSLCDSTPVWHPSGMLRGLRISLQFQVAFLILCAVVLFLS